MFRVPTALLMLALAAGAACAARKSDEPESGPGFGAEATSYLDRVPPRTDRAAAAENPILATVLESALGTAREATARPAAEQPDALQVRERELRNGLRGAERVTAVLDLAALLCELERHQEAVAVLEKVRGDTGDPVLTVALAGVRRDLGQRHLAVAELRRLHREQGALSLHPGLLFELAELEWLEGEAGAARGTLDELRRVHAEDSWVRINDDRVQALAAEIETSPAPRRMKVRDLLGNLRGAPGVGARKRVLEELMAMTRRPGAEPAVRALERTVLAIGVGDASAAVRASAIRFGPPTMVDPAAFFGPALADVDPFVRGIAAQRAAEVSGAMAAPWLLDCLEREQDAAAFAAIDATLAKLAGDAAIDRRLIATDPLQREAIVDRWLARRGELGW